LLLLSLLSLSISCLCLSTVSTTPPQLTPPPPPEDLFEDVLSEPSVDSFKAHSANFSVPGVNPKSSQANFASAILFRLARSNFTVLPKHLPLLNLPVQ
jgi:hypothetical protein